MIGVSSLVWCGTMAAALAPVLTSIGHDLADTAGGDTISVSGSNLIGATKVTVGSTDVSTFDLEDFGGEQLVTFTMPAMAPFVAPSLPRFNGTTNQLRAGLYSQYATQNAYGGWALVRADGIRTDNSGSSAYSNDSLLFTANNAYWGIYLRRSGRVGIRHYQANGALTADLETDFTAADWHLVQWSFNGSVLKLRVDGGPWASVSAGPLNVNGLGELLNIGTSITGAPFFKGDIAELGLVGGDISDANHDSVLASVNGDYQMGLGGIAPRAFDRGALAPAGWWKPGAYAVGASGEWAGAPSAGPSGSRNATVPTGMQSPVAVTPAWGGIYGVTVTTPGGTSNALIIECWSPAMATSATALHRWRPDMGISVDAGLVAALNDSIGAMHQTQSSAGNRVTYMASDPAYAGTPTLTSTGNRWLLGAPVEAIDVPVSVCIVGHSTGEVSSLLGVLSVVPYNVFWATNSLQSLEFYTDRGALRTPGNGYIANPGVILLTEDGTAGSDAAKLYHNDLETPAVTSARRWGSVTHMDIGAGSAGVTYLKGTVAEVVIWSGVLSAADRERLRKYVAIRYPTVYPG
jgi:Concanavalin A-like lectin/glucanases superfamily